MEAKDITNNQELLNSIVQDINDEQSDSIINKINDAHPSDTANLLESLPPDERQVLWEIIPSDQEGEILSQMHTEARSSLIETMDEKRLLAAAEVMDASKLAEVLQELPEDLCDSIVQSLEDDNRARLETILSYDENSAGRLMSTEVLSVRQNVTLKVVQRWLHKHKNIPLYTDSLMVVDNDNQYLGKLPLGDIIIGDAESTVSDAMQSNGDLLYTDSTLDDIAKLFQRRDLISVAVLNKENQLMGRITIDDALKIVSQQADASVMNSAGLKKEEDLFAPVIPSAKRRGFWLGINLVTVFLAAWVIGQFQEVLDKIVVLAVLMPIVASMGGIAGSQTLTLVIRGLALQQIAGSNIRWLTIKEILVGGLNGLLWALVVAIVTFLWFQNSGIAYILAAAMILNLLAASLSGVIIPLVLNRLGIDPALSGAVILTTVTDIIGFLSFLGLATLFLL